MAYPKKNYWVRINGESTSTVITPPGSLVFNEFQANVNAFSLTQNYLTVTNYVNPIEFHDIQHFENGWTVEAWVNVFTGNGSPRTLLSTCGNILGAGTNISVGAGGKVIVDLYNGVGNILSKNNRLMRITTVPENVPLPIDRLPKPREWFHLLITVMGGGGGVNTNTAGVLIFRFWINGVEIPAIWEIINSSSTRIAGPYSPASAIAQGVNGANGYNLWINDNSLNKIPATYPLAIGRPQGVPGPSTASAELGYFSGAITNLAIYFGPKIGWGYLAPVEANFAPNFPIETRSSIYSNLRLLLLVNNDTNKFVNDNIYSNQTTIVNCSGGADGLTANVTPVTFRATSPAGSIITIPGIGGSLYFNGTNMLNFNSNQAFNLGAGSFTLETWIFPMQSQVTTIMGCQLGPSPGRGWLFGMQPSAASQGGTGRLALNFGWTPTGQIWTGTTNFFNSTSSIPLNQWSHIAFVKNTIGGGVIDRYSFYINGIAAGTGATTGTIKYHGTFGIGGTPNESTSGQTYLKGYINNLRVTRAGLYGSPTDATPINFIPTSVLNSVNQTILSLQVLSDTNKYRNNATNNFSPTTLAPIANTNFTNKPSNAASTIAGPVFTGVQSADSLVLPTISNRTVIIPPTGESGRVYPRPKKYVRV
jgi:hypothetical protein